jgi:hypothetical protein
MAARVAASSSALTAVFWTPPTVPCPKPPDHEGTFPTGEVKCDKCESRVADDVAVSTPVEQQPAPSERAPEKVVIAKRTPQVTANKTKASRRRGYNRGCARAYERRRTQRPAPRDNLDYNPISDWRDLVNNR